MTQTPPTPQKHSKNTIIWSAALVIAATILLLFTNNLLDKKPKLEGSNIDSKTFIAEKGQIAPDFLLQEFRGKSYPVSKLEGKVLLLNFWATWCGSCVLEIPSLIELKNEFQSQGLQVAFLSVDADPEVVLPEKLKELKLDFPTFIDVDQKLSDLFEVSAIPLTVILNKRREILYLEPGERDWHSVEVRAQVKQWLSE